MRVLFLFLTSLLFCISFAQESTDGAEFGKADTYYNATQYHKALDLYKALLEKSPSARCYYSIGLTTKALFDYPTSEDNFKLAYSKDYANFPLSLFYVGQTQKLNSKYDSAIVSFDKFIADLTSGAITIKNGTKEEWITKATMDKRGCDLAISQKGVPFRNFNMSVLSSPINSQYNDYAPSITSGDSILKISSGRFTPRNKTVHPILGEAFSDNYRFIKTDGKWSEMPNKDNFQITNTLGDEGAGVFNKDHTKFYFTSCTVGSCNILVSTLKSGKWTKGVKLNTGINAIGSDNKHPSLTQSGDTLFFVSNRTGGIGNNDIWMSVSSGGLDNWSSPVNLGAEINTSQNDMSPYYYAKENILFYSSDGRDGIGGLDVFMVKGLLSSQVAVTNIGPPFNSNSDDAYYCLGVNAGFLASNRKGGAGQFDIYMFDAVSNENIIVELGKNNSLVANKQAEQKLLADNFDATNKTNALEVMDALKSNGGKFESLTPEQKTVYSNFSPTQKQAVKSIVGNKLGHSVNDDEYLAHEVQNGVTPDVHDKVKDLVKSYKSNGGKTDKLSKEQQEIYAKLSPKQKQTLDKYAKAKPKPSKNGKLLTENQDEFSNSFVASFNSDHDNFDNATVTGKLVHAKSKKPAADVKIPLVDGEGNKVKETTTNKNGDFKYVNVKLNKNYKVVTEEGPTSITDEPKYIVKDLKVKGDKKVSVDNNLENVYFDNAKSELRPEAQAALDYMVSFYTSNTSIQIEILAYSDAVGNEEFNQELSSKRGNAVYEYLVSKGVDKSSLVVIPKGEDSPLASNDTRQGRQLNRRVQFNIKGAHFNPAYMMCVLKQNTTLFSLSKAFGMTIDELKEINRLDSDNIIAFRPIRLKATTKKSDLVYY